MNITRTQVDWLRSSLTAAEQDIREWVGLALRQRKEMPRDGALTPCDDGINRSVNIMQHEIADGFKVLAEIEQESIGERCEHGIVDGDWCEACNRAYKEAAQDKENMRT